MKSCTTWRVVFGEDELVGLFAQDERHQAVRAVGRPRRTHWLQLMDSSISLVIAHLLLDDPTVATSV